VNTEAQLSRDSLGVVVVVGELFLAELNVLFDAIPEAAAAACDVADDTLLPSVKREALQSVVLDLAPYYLDNVAVDRLDETVVVTTVRHRH